jgi:hypothetical protein
MYTQDDALTISNPRLLAAVYFSLLAVIATILIDTILYSLGIEQLLPISEAIFLAVVVAACFGALFGERIILSPKPYHTHVFFWAFLMVIAAIPVYTAGFVYLMRENHAALFVHASFTQLIYIYLFVLLYSFILAGLWLAIVAGLAAIYLRAYLVYYVLQSLNQRRKGRGDVTDVSNAKGTKPHDDTA